MDNDGNEQVEFSKLVAEHFDQFTKSEKRIADYICQNQDEASFMSAAEIAEVLGVSEPTMTRFARTLGFDNFPAMRVMLQTKFRKLVNHSARIRSLLSDLRTDGDIYERLVTSEIDFLTESLHTLDRDAFAAAVELLRTHLRVFVFGLGPAVSLVDLLEIRLTRSARHVIPLRIFGREMLEPLLLMNQDDLLIAIGFHSVNPYLQLVLDQANQHNTPVILITDTLGDLVGKNASVVLAARRGPVSAFHSLIVPMTIINTLLLALSSVDQERIMNNLDKLDQLRNSVQPMNDLPHPSKKI
jgi:DNA-binding MurR/RpiR family transcriptional regulator